MCLESTWTRKRLYDVYQSWGLERNFQQMSTSGGELIVDRHSSCETDGDGQSSCYVWPLDTFWPEKHPLNESHLDMIVSAVGRFAT